MYLKLRIDGQLDPAWADWFNGLELHYLPDGSTQLSGFVPDQAALYGLLSRARDLGLSMLSVSVEPADAADEQ